MKSLAYLNKYLSRYKKKLFAGFFFILLSNTTQILAPLFIRDVFDLIENGASFDKLINPIIFFFSLAVIASAFRYLIRQTIIVISREIEFDLLNDLWHHLQKLPYKYYRNTATGKIMAYATNDVGAVRMYLGPGIMYSTDTISKFIFVLIVLFSISPILSFYVLIPLPILSFAVYFLSKSIHKKYTIIQEKFADLTTRAQESFSGIRVIKSYVREEYENESFKKLSDDFFVHNMEKIKIQSLFMPLLYMLAGLSAVIVVWGGGNLVIDKSLSLGDIIAVLVYLGMLIWPMIAFGWVTNMVQQAAVSMKRIRQVFDEKYEIEDSADTNFSITNLNGDIEFKDVVFKYNDESKFQLGKLNFNIKQGETLAVIGHTGSGKTTFVNLLSRMFDVSDGELSIGRTNVKNIPLEVLRGNIGVISQEAFLFSDTIKNNIEFGNNNSGDGKLQKAVEIAALDEEIISFSDKFETILGEKGITLSGGQKQRTCLARAVLFDPQILIMDDSFSAVDTNTEEKILSQIKKFMKERTSVIVSHRISTIKDADNIIVLKNGSIAEQGNHEKLLRLNGIYAGLYEKQLLEDELKELI